MPILDAIPKSLNVEDLLVLGQLSEAGRLGYSGVFHGVIIVQLNRGANIGHKPQIVRSPSAQFAGTESE